jgi:hypothetical protein
LSQIFYFSKFGPQTSLSLDHEKNGYLTILFPGLYLKEIVQNSTKDMYLALQAQSPELKSQSHQKRDIHLFVTEQFHWGVI